LSAIDAPRVNKQAAFRSMGMSNLISLIRWRRDPFKR
jgi:hypothetical protein